MHVEAVVLGVVLEAEAGLRLDPALARQSPPGPGPIHLDHGPTAGPALTLDPGPGVGLGRPAVALAPDPDPAHVPLTSDAVQQNPGAPPLPLHQSWVALLPNCLQITG